jgi:hypothetical protein
MDEDTTPCVNRFLPRGELRLKRGGGSRRYFTFSRAQIKRAGANQPSFSDLSSIAMGPGIADALVVILSHAPLIAPIAAIPVSARIIRPVHDAAEVTDSE